MLTERCEKLVAGDGQYFHNYRLINNKNERKLISIIIYLGFIENTTYENIADSMVI